MLIDIEEGSDLEVETLRRFPYSWDTAFCEQYSDGDHRGYVCTREAGHSGPHVAHGGLSHAFALWEDSDGSDTADPSER